MINSTSTRKVKTNTEKICRFYPFLFIRIHQTEKYLQNMEKKGWRVFSIVLGMFIFFEKSKPCYSEYYFCIRHGWIYYNCEMWFKGKLDKVFAGNFKGTPELKYTSLASEYHLFRMSGYDNNKFREAKKLRKRELVAYEILFVFMRIVFIAMIVGLIVLY